MNSHFVLLVIFSLFVSTVFATLLRDDLKGQASLGLKMLAGLIGSAIALGWLMYPFPL